MTDRTLVLSDAGLLGLVACAAASAAIGSEGRIGIALPTCGHPLRPFLERHAGLFGLLPLDMDPAADLDAAVNLPLLRASEAAAAAGYQRLVWPVQASPRAPTPDVDQCALAIDRALLISRLVSLDAESHAIPDFRIETPYVDMTDAQIAELAVDLDVPVPACCWWDAAEGAAERDRWMPLLRRFGWIDHPLPAR